jgi:Tol biopolymer transport system component
LSWDGRRAVVDIDRDGASDIWLVDLVRLTLSRMTFDPGMDTSPIWSPDGRLIAFASARSGVPNVFWQPAVGGGGAERLTTSSNRQRPVAFVPDGGAVVVEEEVPGQGADLGLLPLHGERLSVVPLVRTPFDETGGNLSPDGRWLAYSSNESGRNEIYLRRFPEADGMWQVSTSGGDVARWSRDGNEIFYRDGRKLMAVTVTMEPSVELSAPTEIFEGPYADSYDVALNGHRFLMIKNSVPGAATGP